MPCSVEFKVATKKTKHQQHARHTPAGVKRKCTSVVNVLAWLMCVQYVAVKTFTHYNTDITM